MLQVTPTHCQTKRPPPGHCCSPIATSTAHQNSWAPWVRITKMPRVWCTFGFEKHFYIVWL